MGEAEYGNLNKIGCFTCKRTPKRQTLFVLHFRYIIVHPKTIMSNVASRRILTKIAAKFFIRYKAIPTFLLL